MTWHDLRRISYYQASGLLIYLAFLVSVVRRRVLASWRGRLAFALALVIVGVANFVGVGRTKEIATGEYLAYYRDRSATVLRELRSPEADAEARIADPGAIAFYRFARTFIRPDGR